MTPPSWIAYATATLEREQRVDMTPVMGPWTRAEWMTDHEWAEAQEWDRAVAALYGVVIDPTWPSR